MNEDVDIEDFAPWLVLLITLIGGCLRMLLLGTKGMWLDETFSVWLASHSIGDMMQWIVKIDQHPPLYYWLLHYWIAFDGDKAYNVRLLSVIFGTGTIPIIYLIGKRMGGVMMGAAAAVILAFSPFNIYYAQETRMYTLLMFNASVAIYALVRLLTDPCAIRPIGSQFREYLHAWRTSTPIETGRDFGFSYKDMTRNQTGWRTWISRRRWSPIQTIETDLSWAALIVFSVLTLLSHNTAILFPIAINIFVLGLILYQRRRKSEAQLALQAPSFSNWAMAQVVILLLWIPWIIPFTRQAGVVYQRFWIPKPTWDGVVQVLKSFLNASGPIPANVATIVWILYALALGFGLIQYRKKISQFLFLAALFAIPFLGELIVSIWRPIFLERTLIWTTIPLFLVVAAGVSKIRFRLLLILVLGSLATINLLSIGDYYKFYQKEDWYSAARDVAGFAEKGDLVLFNSNFVEIPFDYYFKSFETFYDIQVEKRGVPLDLFESGIPEPEMTTKDIPDLRALLSKHNRVWLVYSHNSYTDPNGLIPQTLASEKKLKRSDDFYGGKVELYVNP